MARDRATAAAVPRSASSSAPPQREPTLTALAPRSKEEFARLVRELSEPTGEFLSDNVVSNETSYLQVAERLRDEVPKGRGYVGVGPEQNFTYLALTRPADAYVVDLRRGNLLLHLLYKAAFETGDDRAGFLAMLFARPLTEGPAATTTLAALLDALEHAPATEDGFAAAHRALMAPLDALGLELDGRDRRELDALHRRFWHAGPGLRFALKEANHRRYPALRELLVATTPRGEALGFLATEDAYRVVRDLQRQHRVVPLVGNFAGGKALRGVASELRREGLTLGAHYVSNVEQYLLGTPAWQPWVANVADLPFDARTVFIRAYLDQGVPHPDQLPGHRTATTLQRTEDFLRGAPRYRSMLALCTDGRASR